MEEKKEAGVVNPGDRFEGARIIGMEALLWGVTVEALGNHGFGTRIVFSAAGDGDTGAVRLYNAPFDAVVLVNGQSDTDRELIRRRNDREAGGQ